MTLLFFLCLSVALIIVSGALGYAHRLLAASRAELAALRSELRVLRERWVFRDAANSENDALVRSARRIIALGPTVSRIKMVSTLDISLDVFSSGKALESFLEDHGANFAVVPTFDTDPSSLPWTVLVRTTDGWRATQPGIHQFLYDAAGNGMIPADAVVFEKVPRSRRRGQRLML